MDTASTLRAERRAARLSQAALAARVGTSQATVSAYESGRKRPSLETLSRLLAATGARLTVERTKRRASEPSPERHARTARTLVEVLALAAALPTRHERELRYPRLPS